MAYNAIRRSYITRNNINYDLEYDADTGNVRVIQQNQPNVSPVFLDGNWQNSSSALNLSEGEKQQYRTEIISLVNNAFRGAGGVAGNKRLPQWAVLNSNSNGNELPNEPDGGIGRIIETALNPSRIQDIGNPDRFGADNEKSLFSGAANADLMKYPNDLKTNLQDHISIEMYRYIPKKSDELFNGNFQNILGEGLGTGSGISNSKNQKELIGIVHLPMPNSLSESRDVNWNGDTVSNLNAAAFSRSVNNIGKDIVTAIAGGAIAAGANAATRGRAGIPITGAAKIAGMSGLYLDLIKSAGPDAATLGGTTVLSQLLAQQGIGVDAEAILSRGAGVVPNNNLELLFSGPQLRSFTFSYRLTARSKREAEGIKRIIRFFKQGMSPKKKTGGAGGRSFFLRTPNVYKINFKTVGNANIEGVTRVKICALTSFNTDYTPDGVWAAYDKGQPVSTRITMSFTELEPIFDTDFQTKIESGRDDLEAVKDNEIGY